MVADLSLRGDSFPNNLAVSYALRGQPEKALPKALEAQRLDPEDSFSNLAVANKLMWFSTATTKPGPPSTRQRRRKSTFPLFT